MATDEVAKWCLASISPAEPGCDPSTALTSRHLRMLHFLFDKNLEKAMHILDESGVQRVVGEPSGRTMFQVMGESKGKTEYVCFPDYFCSCPSFFFDVVSRGRQLCCKHQLAARLAAALQICKDVTVSDEELAHRLLNM